MGQQCKGSKNHSDFKYSVSFPCLYTEFTNDDNYAKLTQNLLNSLSLWLNFCIIDAHIYLNKFFSLINEFYRLLHRYRNHLKSLH